MENATKALLMAGAILVAIILIGTGITVLQSAKKPAEQAGKTADAMTVGSFNGQFTQYLGNNIPQNQVKALISWTNSSNAKNSKQVILNGVGAKVGDAYNIGNVTKAYYNVSATGYDKDGYIKIINIQEASSSGNPGDQDART